MDEIQNIVIPIQNAEFILSHDCYGFQEVLDSFETAKEIFICTFNISCSDPDHDELLQALHNKVKRGTKVTFITNVPFDSKKRKSGNATDSNFNRYAEALNPEKYVFSMKLMFNEDLHGKIMMTDKIAYIGSGNYSSFSKNNYEMGVVVRGEETLKEIRKALQVIADKSVDYYHNDFVNAADEIKERILKACDNILQEMKGGEETTDPAGGPDQKLKDLFEELHRSLGELIELLDSESRKDKENQMLVHTGDMGMTWLKEDLKKTESVAVPDLIKSKDKTEKLINKVKTNVNKKMDYAVYPRQLDCPGEGAEKKLNERRGR